MISRIGVILVLLAFSSTLLPQKEEKPTLKPRTGYEIKTPSAPPVHPISQKTFVKSSDISHAPVIEMTTEALGLFMGYVKGELVGSQLSLARRRPLLIVDRILFRTLVSPNAP